MYKRGPFNITIVLATVKKTVSPILKHDRRKDFFCAENFAALLHDFPAAVADGRLDRRRSHCCAACELDLLPYFQPYWRLPRAFYFIVAVLTTIGFDNFVPVVNDR